MFTHFHKNNWQTELNDNKNKLAYMVEKKCYENYFTYISTKKLQKYSLLFASTIIIYIYYPVY
jgi:hypothetical protein